MTEGRGPLAGRRDRRRRLRQHRRLQGGHPRPPARRARRRGRRGDDPGRDALRRAADLRVASPTGRSLADVIELDADQQIAHIELAEAADAIVLAPATANLLGELAAGLVGDAVTAIACASRAPVIVAPAMDAGMWTHPATQRNVAHPPRVRLPHRRAGGRRARVRADRHRPPGRAADDRRGGRAPLRPLRRPRGPPRRGQRRRHARAARPGAVHRQPLVRARWAPPSPRRRATGAHRSPSSPAP